MRSGRSPKNPVQLSRRTRPPLTLVLGGTGFVGTAIQRAVAARGDEYVFACLADPTNAEFGHRWVGFDLLDTAAWPSLDEFDSIIWVAGNSDHGLAHQDPLADLRMNTEALLNLLAHWHGSLTLLSSAAVYFGLEGEVSEGVDHVPPIAYGLSKLAAERYAMEALRDARLERLWIHRLMYAFGPGERERRLLARCVRTRETGEPVTVFGGGRSFLNPLPVDFVADCLVRANATLATMRPGTLEIMNLNHCERWTTLDVVEFLASLGSFPYEVDAAGEEWPVTFWGDTRRLSTWLNRWGMSFPDVKNSLAAYCKAALRRGAQ